MRRIYLLLLLIVAPFSAAFPTVANESDAIWQIVLLASNAETVVSPDARYCLMPESMPIRPGNSVTLRGTDKRTIATASFYDAVVATPDPVRFATDEPCHLIAKFWAVAPRDELHIVIAPEPHPTESSASLSVKIDVGVFAYGPFDWSYDRNGYKECQLLGSSQLGDDSPVVTSPASRLQRRPFPEKTRFNSSVEFSEEREEEYCFFLASLEFPIADEYVIEFGSGSHEAADE